MIIIPAYALTFTVQRLSTLRLAGTAEYAGLNAPENYKRAEMLKVNAAIILKSLPEITVDNLTGPKAGKELSQEAWMGYLPSLPDSLPVICQAPNHHKILFALGHQHLGLTQGAITAKLIGQLIRKNSAEIELDAFCISRFNSPKSGWIDCFIRVMLMI